MTLQALSLILALCLGFGLVYSRFVAPLRRFRKDSLPPGPLGHWLFGNERPGPYAYRKYAGLVETYGPVVLLRYGSRVVCIVGRYQAAVDILSKHSSETADRPRSVAGNEILSQGMRTVLTGTGERLKKVRRALHAFLQRSVAETYKPMQTRYAKNYILDCYHRPEGHMQHTRRYAASVVLTMTYGKTSPTYYSDFEVQEINKCLRRLGAALRPGAYLADTYPLLKYIPGYASELRLYQKEELALFKRQVDVVKQQIARGEARPSFAEYLLRNQARLELSDDELAYLTGSIYGAGSDTTAAAMSIINLAAALYPEAQLKVQAQLDRVVGRNRAPSFDDEKLLPEVTAFVLETFRWRPVAAGGFIHRATKDIVWNNYVIPAGAEIVGNHWAIGRDPELYPDPEVFNPQRWLHKDGSLRDDLKFFNYGFGRRICVGQHVADNSLFINTALVMWAFTISQDLSKRIDPSAFTDDILIEPLPFSANFTPRIDNLREVLGITEE